MIMVNTGGSLYFDNQQLQVTPCLYSSIEATEVENDPTFALPIGCVALSIMFGMSCKVLFKLLTIQDSLLVNPELPFQEDLGLIESLLHP